MGNSGSAAVAVEGTQRNCSKSPSSDLQQPKSRIELHQQRGTSCKFTRPKVLPDLGSPLRLRRTDNGDILHNGGTISARRQEFNKAALERDALYGSEPDLRINSRDRESIYLHANTSKLRASRCKKKYRAPKVPGHTMGSSSPDSCQEGEVRDEQVSRRMRLFKTKNECRKAAQDESQPFHHFNPPVTSLQRSLSTPQFDGDLLNSSERLKLVRPQVVGGDSSLVGNSLDRKECEAIRPSSPVHNTMGPPGVRTSADGAFDQYAHQSSHEYTDALRCHNKAIRPTTKTSAPVKRFYFGMDLNDDLNETLTVDNFRTKLQMNQDNLDGFISLPSSESVEVIDEDGGISVQLRATLPRKQLDIPQFSPITAWRLLSCGETMQRGEAAGQCEEELEVHNSHLHHHHHYHHHVLLVDKSQDSGISADDSPRIDSQAAWTPQQDLEETSSDGGFPPFAAPSENCQIARFSPRFILSLPREDRLSSYPDVKGGYGDRGRKERAKGDESRNEGGSPLIDSNWVLSRSMPSLVNTASLRPAQWNSVDVSFEDEELASALVKQPSFSYLANGGHIMYLPQYSKYRITDKVGRSVGGLDNSLSKSCEDVASEAVVVAKESAQTPPESIEVTQPKSEKKFTFQSTIRQLERKRLAEKLSREAETKENERRLEVEAMRKAEEEFQRKREREKVGIRQQLRLFSLSNNPASTQILSEYHIPSRDYREYRNKFTAEGNSPTPESRKKSTVHPAVTYQIPKSTQIYFNPRMNSERSEESANQALGVDNYRKKFAQGGVAGSLIMSDQSPISHLTSFDHHIRGDRPSKVKGAIPLVQSNRLSEARPTGL
ncbi:uncharacterized protein isoform X2 [Rhodnius prolixus]|uniref:uncharacterized protein isoform X2 n=1 Tax=Rhodnius prolixus TaxID=13249 RepID=UPI003D18AFBD